jgi:predicted O-linked N-acetylglucosamine transferase (SPINDLY family)
MDAQAYTRAGIDLLRKGDAQRALEVLILATEVDPIDHLAWYYRGSAAFALGQFDEAVPSYRHAIRVRPDLVQAYFELGSALRHLAHHEESVTVLREALRLDPSRHDVHSLLIFVLDLCPGVTIAEQQAERKRWYERHAFGKRPEQPFANTRDPDRRLRVGYVSADFRMHSAALAFGPVMLRHDRAAFEVFCYSGTTAKDHLTETLQRAADAWRETHTLTDADMAQAIRSDRIDLLVDLSGHSFGHRLHVFARKPAPVQITAFGHATGTGLPTMDYLLSDPVTVPAEARPLFAEHVLDLPCPICYWAPYDAPRVSTLPSLAGQPFTFGSNNRVEKLSDQTLRLWARILRAAPQTRLQLKSARLDLPSIRVAVLRAFSEHAIEPERVVLRGATYIPEHLAALHEVDVALDPTPQNGGITTAETLWMGVPVVALLGETPGGRLSASLLTATGLEDWIAYDENEYVDIAVSALVDRPYLARLRADMRRRLARTPPYDLAAYTKSVESVYRQAWRQWCSGGRE